MKLKKYCWLVYMVTAVAMLAVPYWGSKSVTALAENSPVPRDYCIILDAGHGGVDGGATSCTGKLESAYNLEITKRLEDLFHLLGYDTRMIRTTDISIYTKGETIAQKKISDLKERVRLVNETDNGILVSIHQNNFTDSRYHGAQIFYGPSSGSAELAKTLQTAFSSTLNPDVKRSCKRSSGIYLMDHIQRTGVLIECGFLSNPQEEANLRAGEYQKKICSVIAATLSTFLSNT